MPSSHITLTVVAYHGQALVDGARATFDTHGGTIGRDSSNLLPLPGDDGLVARHHATVSSQAGHWQLLNTSGYAAIAINGKMLAPGAQTNLQAGDIVNMGAYVLRAGVDAVPAAWDLPALAALAGSERTGVHVEAAAPLRFEMPAAPYSADPLTGFGSSAGTADLLDTPLDPLLLFGTAPAWSSATALEPPGLFADLSDTRSSSAFDASSRPNMHGYAVRDAVPEHGSHLRLQIASLAPAPVQAQAQPAAEVWNFDPSSFERPRPDSSGSVTSGDAGDATAPGVPDIPDVPGAPGTARTVAPEYGAQFGAPTVLRPAGPIRIVEPTAAAPLVEPADHHAPILHELARHFLEGAAIEPGSAAEAGLNRQVMYTLGKLVRSLMPPRS